jgi:dolichyl-phosphate-mannose-protein mannosyltransferase
MQHRSVPSSNNTSTSSRTTTLTASSALRRNIKTESDDEDISDPRPWEKAKSLRTYGSTRDQHPLHSALNNPASGSNSDLPMYSSVEDDGIRKRGYGDKIEEPMNGEKDSLIEDDQGKWEKGHGPGPGVGGRRGLPPRRRVEGWVSLYIGCIDNLERDLRGV